jgi:hypothetical protein
MEKMLGRIARASRRSARISGESRGRTVEFGGRLV